MLQYFSANEGALKGTSNEKICKINRKFSVGFGKIKPSNEALSFRPFIERHLSRNLTGLVNPALHALEILKNAKI